MILFINACVRKESRTKRLAYRLLSTFSEPFTELSLNDIEFPAVDGQFLDKRDKLTAARNFSDPMFDLARQFAAADRIVIAAPLWDLSFPAVLKQYFEHINVPGVTFCYMRDGTPKGLCRAESLTYITTVGGNFFPEEYGFGYVKALATCFYGIKDVRLIKAIGLDIDGADVGEIIRSVEKTFEEQKNKE